MHGQNGAGIVCLSGLEFAYRGSFYEMIICTNKMMKIEVAIKKIITHIGVEIAKLRDCVQSLMIKLYGNATE